MHDQNVIIDLALEPRKRPLAAGWAWLQRSYQLYRQAPVPWLKISTLFFGLMLLTGLLPVLGFVVSVIIAPIFLGGIAVAAQRTVAGQLPPVEDLVLGFKTKASELAKVGGFYILGGFAVVVAVSMLTGILHSIGLIGALPEKLESLQQIRHLWPIGVLLLVGLLGVYSAYFYAPILVMLDQLSAGEAMKMSWVGFWRNWLPLMMMSLLLAVILFAALMLGTQLNQLLSGIPLLADLPLFVVWCLCMPLVLISSYVCYADVFVSTTPTGDHL